MSVDRIIRYACLAVVACLIGAGIAQASPWQTAQLLNQIGEPYCKNAKVYAAKTGGFHTVYLRDGRLHYRRYQNSVMGGAVSLHSGHFIANPDVCEAGNGDIHVVWEDWNPSPDIHWLKSLGGATWPVNGTNLTNWGNWAKWPLMAPFGSDTSAQVVMSCYQSHSSGGGDRRLYYNSYGGSSWSGITSIMNQNADAEYQVFGMCRSLADGTIYRSYGTQIGGVISVCYRRYNGTSWEPQVVVDTGGFFARHDIAVNPAGQIMLTWERDDKMWWRLYTPGVGWSAIGSLEYLSRYSALTAIPGSNDFYLVYDYDMKTMYGRRFSGAGWLPRETVSVGQAQALTYGSDVTAGPDGTLYACWEYWGTSDAQQWYSVKPGMPQPSGTISGTVRDQYGLGISGVTIGSGEYQTISMSGGAYSVRMPVGTYSVSANKDYYGGQTVNSVGVTNSGNTIVNFTVTSAPPANVPVFSVCPTNGYIRLFWTNPASGNFAGTMIRYKTTGYPTSPTDGILVCDRAGAPSSTDNWSHVAVANGVTCYYTAFAHDADSHYASGVTKQGTQNPQTCQQIKQFDDNTTADLFGKVVTEIFAEGFIYVEEPTRTSGIRVLNSGAGLVPGTRINLTGTVTSINQYGYPAERVISSPTISNPVPGSPLKPLAMNCRNIGGVGLPPNCLGVNDGVGPNNVGLFVRVAGRVTLVLGNYVYIDDGSNVQDTTSRTGIMLECPTTSTLVPGNIVSATGIVGGSMPDGWTTSRRCVRLRDMGNLALISSNVGTVSGYVTDSNWNAVSGATVSTTSGGYSTTTTSDGWYSFPSVIAGKYTVVATKTGYTTASQAITLASGQNLSLDLVISPNVGTISGLVRNSSSIGIPGATVTTSTGGYTATTNSSGGYTISAVTPGTYSVTASKTGYNPQTLAGKTVTAGGTTYANFILTTSP